MKPIRERNCIQIEVTNYCNLKCQNCTRLIGHHIHPYFMELDYIEKALKSLKGFKNIIGLMGGEPTMHPDFHEICLLYQKHVPKTQRGLWTNGFKWNENDLQYDKIIRETFPIENIVYNRHDYEYINQHQPVLIPSLSLIKDVKLWEKIVDKCWVPERWSASINPKGCYFCEVAGALDMLYEFNVGWKIEDGWWVKNEDKCRDQIKACCPMCSMAIPLDKNHKLPNPYTKKDYRKNKKDWKPWMFRDFWQHEPNKRIYK